MSANLLLKTYLCLEIRLAHFFTFLVENRKKAIPSCTK